MQNLRICLMVGLFLGFCVTASAQDLLPPDRPINEVIDHYLDANLSKEGVIPVAEAPSTTLVRRLHLDLAGRIPTAVEAQQYTLSIDPSAKAKLIESLLSSPEFARHNANEFDIMLSNNNPDAPNLRPYFLNAFKENRPWDAMFRDLMGVSDAKLPTKPESFILKRLKDLDTLTRDVSSIFFGLNITCAQCHRHPEVKTLTQDYFFGMKAFFSYSYEFNGHLLDREFVPLADFKTKTGETRKTSALSMFY